MVSLGPGYTQEDALYKGVHIRKQVSLKTTSEVAYSELINIVKMYSTITETRQVFRISINILLAGAV